MNPLSPAKEIVTVTEMARLVGLSRSRFYQLMKQGVFPSPSRNPETKRPYYDRQGQETCLRIRRQNLGVNGTPVLFYAQQPRPPVSPQEKRTGRNLQKATSKSVADPVIDDIQHGLEQLGMSNVSAKQIEEALSREFAHGHAEVPASELLMAVFKNLKATNA